MAERDDEFAALPEGMTAWKLRDIANWLDTYERLAEAHVGMVKTLVAAGVIKHDADHEAILRIVGNKAVQTELRAWADAIEAKDFGSSAQGPA